MFDLELIDASGLFTVEPKSATGSTNVAIRLANGPLDYENPNHQKFILVVSKQLQHPDKTFSFFYLRFSWCTKRAKTASTQQLCNVARSGRSLSSSWPELDFCDAEAQGH